MIFIIEFYLTAVELCRKLQVYMVMGERERRWGVDRRQKLASV